MYVKFLMRYLFYNLLSIYLVLCMKPIRYTNDFFCIMSLDRQVVSSTPASHSPFVELPDAFEIPALFHSVTLWRSTHRSIPNAERNPAEESAAVRVLCHSEEKRDRSTQPFCMSLGLRPGAEPPLEHPDGAAPANLERTHRRHIRTA